MIGLYHAPLRMYSSRTLVVLFVPVVHSFLPLVYTFVSLSRYVLVSFSRPPRRRAARAMTMHGKLPESVARASTTDARAIDRSIDRFRLVSSRSRPSIDSIRARVRARVRNDRARFRVRARPSAMTFKIFVGGARVDSNAVLSDAWNSSSVRARRSRAREASGERREARCAPNLGFCSNAHFLGLLTVRLTDDENLCVRRRVDDRA